MQALIYNQIEAGPELAQSKIINPHLCTEALRGIRHLRKVVTVHEKNRILICQFGQAARRRYLDTERFEAPFPVLRQSSRGEHSAAAGVQPPA